MLWLRLVVQATDGSGLCQRRLRGVGVLAHGWCMLFLIALTGGINIGGSAVAHAWGYCLLLCDLDYWVHKWDRGSSRS